MKKQTVTQERTKIPVKLILVLTLLCAVSVLSGLGLFKLAKAESLMIKNLYIEGNTHIEDSDVSRLLDVNGQSIVTADMDKLSRRLFISPWVKKVYMRKELPNSLAIRIVEKVPVAAALDKDVIYLVDENGIKLQRLGRKPEELPVIKITGSNKKAYLEAIKLSLAISKNPKMRGMVEEIDGTKPEDISIRINGVPVYVGFGDFDRKLTSYISLKDEIVKRNIPVDYIDLRFSHRLIVKPLKGDI
ncbi:cell division protein FtsQ/DivIB [Candidatus Magnetomonas plexicatena]|uniref:cell division protein FtsQ/DivIB n=1 Tax=Candidatus Magnetomonas plexicatena TaxID=2552947 RepID=UPI001C73E561|nr:FtsQ-type POTRA domain-containing protein [Nitrospirales bacterium LBB_01]